jgi:hypothetical protein
MRQPKQTARTHADLARVHKGVTRLIIQTIRRDPSRTIQVDEASNVSRPDPSGLDQIDAEHQATDLAVGVRIPRGAPSIKLYQQGARKST